jgi:hypothetical protein
MIHLQRETGNESFKHDCQPALNADLMYHRIKALELLDVFKILYQIPRGPLHVRL